MNHTKMLIG